MAAIIIPNQGTFGAMTNSIVGKLNALQRDLPRLQDAIATASSGFTGTPGTEFEAPTMGANAGLPNNFMVQPDPETPGTQGTAYAYAVGQLKAEWDTFLAAAQAYIDALDNGTGAL